MGQLNSRAVVGRLRYEGFRKGLTMTTLRDEIQGKKMP